MNAFPLIISSDQIPSSFCPLADSDWQFLVSQLHASISGDPSWNIGNATPDPDQRDKPWLRFSSDGVVDRVYSFVNGIWQSPHLTPPGIVSLYRGDATLIDTLDGGTAGAVTPIAGPFWALVTELSARFPIGPGALPSGTVIPVLGTGGEETHQLVEDESPTHRHFVANSDTSRNPSGAITLTSVKHATFNSQTGDGNAYVLQGNDTESTVGLTSQAGNDTAHNNMPPFYGIYFIERTARTHFVQNA